MDETKIVRPPGSLSELEEAAKKESFARKGAEAIIENYARRNDMTIEEARKKLGYKGVQGVTGAVNAGAITRNEDGTIDDESVERYIERKKKNPSAKKEPIAPAGMTQEKFDSLTDDTKIVVTAGMLRQLAEKIRAEERANMVPIDMECMLHIARTGERNE